MNDTVRVLIGFVFVLGGAFMATRKKSGVAFIGAVLMLAGGWYAIEAGQPTIDPRWEGFWAAVVVLVTGLLLVSPKAPANGATPIGLILAVLAIIYALRVHPLNDIPVVGDAINEMMDVAWEKLKDFVRPVVNN